MEGMPSCLYQAFLVVYIILHLLLYYGLSFIKTTNVIKGRGLDTVVY